MTKKLFIIAIVVLGATFAAHLYAYVDRLYFETWWLDIPMHFFGGVGVGFLGLWYAMWRGFIAEGTGKVSIGGVTIDFNGRMPWWWTLEYPMLGIAIIAPAWEVAEMFMLAYFRRPIPQGLIGDTVLDIVLGTVGALVAWAVFHHVHYGYGRAQ